MATLAVISHRVGLHDLLTHLHLLQDTLRHQGAWGYLVYAALFIIATLCLIPGSLLVIADTLARTLVAPQQLPVGVLTALIGVPVFLFLLTRDARTRR